MSVPNVGIQRLTAVGDDLRRAGQDMTIFDAYSEYRGPDVRRRLADLGREVGIAAFIAGYGTSLAVSARNLLPGDRAEALIDYWEELYCQTVRYGGGVKSPAENPQ